MQSAAGQVCCALGLQLRLCGQASQPEKGVRSISPGGLRTSWAPTICCVKLSQENLQPHSGSGWLALKDKGCRGEGVEQMELQEGPAFGEPVTWFCVAV